MPRFSRLFAMLFHTRDLKGDITRRSNAPYAALRTMINLTLANEIGPVFPPREAAASCGPGGANPAAPSLFQNPG